MMIHQNLSKLWMAYDNDKCFLDIIRRTSTSKSNEGYFSQRQKTTWWNQAIFKSKAALKGHLHG